MKATSGSFQDIERSPGNLNYDQEEKSALLWALGVGTFIGVWPFNYLYLHYGARFVFFGAGLLSAFSTAIIPYTAYLGLGWFITARVVQVCCDFYRHAISKAFLPHENFVFL